MHEEKELTLTEKIDLYADLNLKKKSVEEAMEPLNKELKETIRKNGVSELATSSYKVVLSLQDRSKMNVDKLLIKLKALGLNEAIKTVEVPDEAAIQRLIYEQRLDAQILQDCMDKKIVEVLNVRKVSKK